MEWLRILASRFLAIVRKRTLDSDLDEELRAHLEALAEENIRRRGMSEQAARQAARREFGGLEQTKESYRSQRAAFL